MPPGERRRRALSSLRAKDLAEAAGDLARARAELERLEVALARLEVAGGPPAGPPSLPAALLEIDHREAERRKGERARLSPLRDEARARVERCSEAVSRALRARDAVERM